MYILVLENKISDGVIYNGFALRNYAGVSIYNRVTIEECQYLCEITAQCRYFNYGNISRDYDDGCYLKFGVGHRLSIEREVAFGHKFSSGEELTFAQAKN